MHITSSLLIFIFLGVAAARVIPEIAVRDNTVAGGKGGHGVGLPSGVLDHPVPSGNHDPAPVSRRDNPTDVPHPSVSLADVSDHPKPTGKHSHAARFRRDEPTDIPHPPVSIPAVSDHPKPTGEVSHAAGSRRDNPIDLPHPPASLSDVSDGPKPTGKISHSAGSRRDNPIDIPHPPASLSDVSDRPKPTGKHFRSAGSRRGKHSHPAASRRANPTDVGSYIPAPHSTDLKDPHSHHSAARRNVLSIPTNVPSQGSDHPEHAGEPSRPLASHKARAVYPSIIHSIHPISRRASPTDTDPHHHQGGSEHPKPTGKAA